MIETRQYNDLNQLQYLETSKLDEQGNKEILTSYTYTLDKVGNRLSIQDHTGRVSEYDYDDLYRLEQGKVTAVGGVHTIDFAYDNVGNRLSQTDSTKGTTTYVYDDNDRLISETKEGVTTTYTYDDNGNTFSKSSGAEQTTYVWNDENRLVEVQTADGKAINYQYDTDGIRMSSVVNGVRTNYLVDKNRDYAQVLEEYVDGELSVTYVYGRDLISQERGSQTSFYLVDGLGSTTALTDASGNITDTYSYEAFGELQGQSGVTENNYQFTGEQFDRNLGEYYLRQRYYDSETGRFIRRDSYEGNLSNPLTQNKYTYTHSDPVNAVDPSGLYRLELRYRGVLWTHSDIFITDRNGSRAYWATSQNSNNFSSGVSNNFFGFGSAENGFGYLIDDSATTQRSPNFFEGGSQQILLDTNNDNDVFPRFLENSIKRTLQRIEEARIPYHFLKRNSNSASFQALEETFGFRPEPDRILPGWKINPFTGKESGNIPDGPPDLAQYIVRAQPFYVDPTGIFLSPLF